MNVKRVLEETSKRGAKALVLRGIEILPSQLELISTFLKTNSNVQQLGVLRQRWRVICLRFVFCTGTLLCHTRLADQVESILHGPFCCVSKPWYEQDGHFSWPSANNPLKEQGVLCLSESLADMKTLTTLNLSSTQMGDKGLFLLLPVLKKTHLLQSIDLRSNNFTSVVMPDLLQTLQVSYFSLL